MLSHSSSLKSRVLIITNSDVALSDQVADYYIAAHGLVSHKMAFAFGTDMKFPTAVSDAFMTTVVPQIATYCADNDIKAVLCSAGVPELMIVLPDTHAPDIGTRGSSPSDGYYSFSAFVAAARIFDAAGAIPRWYQALGGCQEWVKTASVGFFAGNNLAYTASAADEPDFSTATGALQYTIRKPSWHDDRAAPVVPSAMAPLLMIGGRIGYPGNLLERKTGGGVLSTTTETFEETKRIIDDAVAMEGIVNGPMHFCIGDYNQALNVDALELCRRKSLAYGYDTRHTKNSTTGTIPIPTSTYNAAAFLAGTLNPKQPLWGYYGNIVVNKGIGDPWINSVTLQRGAWGHNWCSYSMELGYQMLKAGACCVAGTWTEPYTQGLPTLINLFSDLLKGISMSEAIFAFNPGVKGWALSVWGDPLYRPFANRKPPGGFSISDKDFQ